MGKKSKASLPPRSAPKNDYAQHFVDTGLRPANYIYEEGIGTNARFAEYPKLQKLVALKDQLVQQRATPPAAIKADLKTFDLTTLPTKFDVILIDPPWEEYQQRMEAAANDKAHIEEVWSPQDIAKLQIDAISESPSFVFLWCGTGISLEWGRHFLQKWGYRRCEDICWIKSNRESRRNLQYLHDGVLSPSTEHCLVGIKGTVRRNFDGHIIHANVDTDVIVSEEPAEGSTAKPAELYSVIERFCNGMRRLELFGGDHNKRRGWLTIGKDISQSDSDPTFWASQFEGTFECRVHVDESRKLPNHLVGTSPEIESLRPKSPTQLREEAEVRILREHRVKEEADRIEYQRQVEAAAEMGIELEPLKPSTPAPLPALTGFVEQHPFNAGVKDTKKVS